MGCQTRQAPSFIQGTGKILSFVFWQQQWQSMPRNSFVNVKDRKDLKCFGYFSQCWCLPFQVMPSLVNSPLSVEVWELFKIWCWRFQNSFYRDEKTDDQKSIGIENFCMAGKLHISTFGIQYQCRLWWVVQIDILSWIWDLHIKWMFFWCNSIKTKLFWNVLC